MQAMSHTFQPRCVPSDVIARWPVLAMTLWKRSFRQQAIVLLGAALLLKIFPAWSTLVSFVIAPALFFIAFAAVQIADEKKAFAWMELATLVLPGTVRLCGVSLKFAAGFGALAAVLSALASALVRHDAVAAQQAAFAEAVKSVPAAAALPDTLAGEFIHFCATWTQGVMAMMFVGMFIVAIYQGVFGAVLHAREGMGTRQSRRYGWQAWQVNAGSIEQALREAPRAFWICTAAAAAAIICAFQTVYFSPAGLLLATYVPCLAYVAYRSIFLGRHENVPAARRSAAQVRAGLLAPVATRQARWVSRFVAKPK